MLAAGGCSSPEQGARFADVASVSSMMGETLNVSESEGEAVMNGAPTAITAYDHQGVLYVAFEPFVRYRRAVLLRGEQPVDAIVWPQQALSHLKKSGLTEGRAYQTAVREGLVPR